MTLNNQSITIRYVSLMWSLFLIKTPIFEWNMVELVLMNRHQKDMCHNENGLCAQNVDTLLNTIVMTSVII